MKMNRGYVYTYRLIHEAVLPWETVSHIFAVAAIHLEAQPQYDANWAIAKAADYLPEHVGLAMRYLFFFSFGQAAGDVGVLLLGFASAMAETGDYPENLRMFPIGP